MHAALAELAPQDREVLVLRFLEQLNIEDTAAALGISESAVKSASSEQSIAWANC